MIHVEALTKRYGDKLALDEVSFDVQAGQVVGLLGLNGAGKSTAMNILTGYIGPSSGTVTIDGHDVAQEPLAAKRVIGYLPERLAFYNDMRVDEYLDYVCDLKGVADERESQVASICERVGIVHMTGRLIRNLSKGYRQRLGFAQALIGGPKVLILDEPTAGLDPSQIVEIRALIQQLGATSTVIISSHVLSEVQAICGRILVLHNGRLVADDTPERLGSAMGNASRVIARIQGKPGRVIVALSKVPGLERVTPLAQAETDAYDYVIESAPDCDVRAAVFRALAEADMPLLGAHSREASLEQAFLRVVSEQETEEGR